MTYTLSKQILLECIYGETSDESLSQDLGLQSQRQSVNHLRSRYPVQCLPLYTLLLAMGNPTVDFFSLDVEGAEIKVLETIPFDKVDIK